MSMLPSAVLEAIASAIEGISPSESSRGADKLEAHIGVSRPRTPGRFVLVSAPGSQRLPAKQARNGWHYMDVQLETAYVATPDALLAIVDDQAAVAEAMHNLPAANPDIVVTTVDPGSVSEGEENTIIAVRTLQVQYRYGTA